MRVARARRKAAADAPLSALATADEVKAALEDLVEVRGRDAAAFARLAWHLGNRHLPVQLLGDRIRIRHDHVITEMVEGLGGHVDDIEAPFDPEPGAYAQSGGHHHHHHDDDADHHH